jgi:hypothetical protein
MRSLDARWNELIPGTLANAVRAPYYQRRFGRRWRQIRTVDDLSALPLLDKATAATHQRELVVGAAPPGLGVVSSGTTRTGSEVPPLNVLHSVEEAEAIRGDSSADPIDEPDLHPGWTLVSVGVSHGLPNGARNSDELMVPWMYHRNALHMLETVLTRPQPDGRRVTAMRISAGGLKTFTTWLLQRGKDPSALGLRLIGSNGSRVSTWWRRLIEETFRADLYDNYSLSEFATPATECKACGWLHFGWPPVLYEVLDLVTGERRPEGAGRLVLTGLHPYVQKMPLVRYDTGDAVELGSFCRVGAAQRIRFLGRIRRGLILPDARGGSFVLAPSNVQDVLEAMPETERNPHPFEELGYLRSRELGLPRWTVEDAGGPEPLARLNFEVRFDPALFRDEARALQGRVLGELLRLEPGLRAKLRNKTLFLDVRAVAPQSLSPPPDKFD